MKHKTNNLSKNKKKKRRLGSFYLICWVIIPIAVIILLILDGLGLYLFNTERLIVVGICTLIILIPFFSEITIKNITLKKENDSSSKK